VRLKYNSKPVDVESKVVVVNPDNASDAKNTLTYSEVSSALMDESLSVICFNLRLLMFCQDILKIAKL
jgi:hypothetical protein